MRTTIFSIFMVTVLTLTFQSIASGEKNGKKEGMMMEMSASVGHGSKNKDDMLDQISKIFNICKAFAETIVALTKPIFDAKMFGLAAISTFMSIIGFIMNLKNSKANEKKESWELGNTIIGNEEKIGMPYEAAYRPAYFAHYPTLMHKYRVHS